MYLRSRVERPEELSVVSYRCLSAASPSITSAVVHDAGCGIVSKRVNSQGAVPAAVGHAGPSVAARSSFVEPHVDPVPPHRCDLLLGGVEPARDSGRNSLWQIARPRLCERSAAMDARFILIVGTERVPRVIEQAR